MSYFRVEPRTTGETHICDAIDKKDWKTAEKLITVKLKKKTDTYLEALEFYVGCHHPSVILRGHAVMRLLMAADSPHIVSTIGGLQEMQLYNEGAKVLGTGAAGKEIFSMCRIMQLMVQASPKNKELGEACVRECLGHKAYDIGREIAQSLQTNFKEERKYLYWTVYFRWLCSKPHLVLTADGPVSAEEKSMVLQSTLAKGTLLKWAKQTPKEVSKTAPIGSIQTPEELALLHSICGFDEAVKFDEKAVRLSTLIGHDSPAAKGAWEFKRIHIKELRHYCLYTELFNFCLDLIMASVPEDSTKSSEQNQEGLDWLVWENIIFAISKDESLSLDEIFRRLLKRVTDPTNLKRIEKTWRRNVLLAVVEYIFSSPSAGEDSTLLRLLDAVDDKHKDLDSDELVSIRVSALMIYYDHHFALPAAFGDLKHYLDILDLEEQQQFLKLCGCVPQKPTVFGVNPNPQLLGSRCVYFNEDRFKFQEGLTSDKVTRDVTRAKLEYMVRSLRLRYGIQKSSDPALSAKSENLLVSTSPKFCAWCGLLVGNYQSCQNCLWELTLSNIHQYGTVVREDDAADGSIIANNLLITDKHPADDHILIAAMSQIKLGLQLRLNQLGWSGGTTRLLQAAVLLEYGASRSKANAQFSILLVRVYILLGVGALAMRAYQNLNLKNVQLDTLGYMLMDRIASLHPHKVSETFEGLESPLDPKEHLLKLQSMYKKGREQIKAKIWMAFENGSYNSTLKIMEAQGMFYNSCGTAMSVTELRRLHRLTDSQPLDKSAISHELLGNFVDNSDYACFPDFESKSEAGDRMTFAELSRFGTPMSHKRTKCLILVDELWAVLVPKTTSFSEYRYFVDKLISIVQAIDQQDIHEWATLPEQRLFIVAMNMVYVLRFSSTDDRWIQLQYNYERIKPWIICAVEHVEKIYSTAVDEDVVPDFIYTFHPLYIYHELAQLVLRTCQVCTKSEGFSRTGLNVNRFDDLLADAKRLEEAIKRTTERVKSSINRSGQIDRVLSAIVPKGAIESQAIVMGEEIQALCGEAFMENFAGEVAKAWQEGVVGLTRLPSFS